MAPQRQPSRAIKRHAIIEFPSQKSADHFKRNHKQIFERISAYQLSQLLFTEKTNDFIMGNGIQDLNPKNFGLVQDALYYAKGFIGYSRQERRRQTFAFRLRKDRARQCLEERQRRQRRRADLPEIPEVVRRTEVRAWIAAMQPPVKPRAVFAKIWRNKITRQWQRVLRKDPSMADLLEMEKNGIILGTVPQLLVLELEASTDSLDLDEIHPIFSKANMERSFLATELDLMALHRARMYMRPALALATKFLTDPQLGDFWYHLMYGSPITDKTSKKSYLRTDPREADLKTARADWLALLDEMASRMQFHWQPTDDRRGSSMDACHASHGFLTMIKDFLEIPASIRRRLTHPDVGFNGIAGLSAHFLWHLLNPNSATRRSMEADLSFQFAIAVTLVHELAHAVYAFCRLPSINFKNGHTEIYAYSTDFDNEIGWSFENHLWNGVIVQGDMRRGTDCDLTVKTWDDHVLRSPFMHTDVPESWLRDIFRKKTWNNFANHVDVLPRPSGRNRNFVAERWIEGVGFKPIDYVDGKMINTDKVRRKAGSKVAEPKIKGDLKTWWKKVRDEDIDLALKHSHYFLEVRWGPRMEILGYGIERKRWLKSLQELSQQSQENGDESSSGREDPSSDSSDSLSSHYWSDRFWSERERERERERDQRDASTIPSEANSESSSDSSAVIPPADLDDLRFGSGPVGSANEAMAEKDEEVEDAREPSPVPDEEPESMPESTTPEQTESSDSAFFGESELEPEPERKPQLEQGAEEAAEESEGLKAEVQNSLQDLNDDSDVYLGDDERGMFMDSDSSDSSEELPEQPEGRPEDDLNEALDYEMSEPEEDSDDASTGDSTLDEYADDRDEVLAELTELPPPEDVLFPYKYF